MLQGLRICILRFARGMYFLYASYMPSRAGPEDMGERQALPLYPLDSLTPFLTRVATLDPGLGAK